MAPATESSGTERHTDTSSEDHWPAHTSRLRQAESTHDRLAPESTLAGMEVPADAGVHRDDLIAILSRIPPHWGRWIDCEAGWFGLITELHGHLVELDPNYVVQQIKQKHGVLRYYAGSSIDDLVIQDRFAALVDIAERLSRTVCELCSNLAQLSVSDANDPVYKTICTSCAEQLASSGGPIYRPYIAPPR